MAGRQDGTPLADAAALLGLSPEAARKRLNRGTLDGYKVAGAWFVVLTPQDTVSGQVAGRQDAVSGRQDTPDQPNNVSLNPVTPAEVERAIEATATRYMADFAGLYDRISADVAARYEQTIAAKDETITLQRDTIAELRERLAVAEAEKVAPAAPQPRTAEEAPPASDSTPIAPAPAGGFWQRLRRAIVGE